MLSLRSFSVYFLYLGFSLLPSCVACLPPRTHLSLDSTHFLTICSGFGVWILPLYLDCSSDYQPALDSELSSDTLWPLFDLSLCSSDLDSRLTTGYYLLMDWSGFRPQPVWLSLCLLPRVGSVPRGSRGFICCFLLFGSFQHNNIHLMYPTSTSGYVPCGFSQLIYFGNLFICQSEEAAAVC